VPGGGEPTDVTLASQDDGCAERADTVDVGDGGPLAATASVIRSWMASSSLSSRRTSPSSSRATRRRSAATTSAGRIVRSSCPARLALKCGGATWDEQTQQGVQPAHGLGPQRGQVVVTVSQQPQHRRVIDRCDDTQISVGARLAALLASKASTWKYTLRIASSPYRASSSKNSTSSYQ
jgi:hypothetical protein